MTDKLLEIKDLCIEYCTSKGVSYAVNGLSLSIVRGETLGIAGESGSGKSTLALGVMQLLPQSARVSSGSILFEGNDILKMSASELGALRGSGISMIFQDPMQSLDPSFTIAYQLSETLLAHEKASREEAKKASLLMLRRVGIQDAEDVMKKYQHELSGGMRQRVMIAMALITGPKLLIADEPTAALDVTIQDQILRLLKSYAQKEGMSMLFITHSFGVVANICDRAAVLYGGRLCESGSTAQLLSDARHPYTRALLEAVPGMEKDKRLPLFSIDGAPLDVFATPKGCPFAPRCGKASGRCSEEHPPEREVEPGHFTACLLDG